jgi:hypothetical protein
MQTIIFGTKRLGVSDIPQTNEKYTDKAVVTIESVKEGGKSRRVLFNKSAAEMMLLVAGNIQHLTFGVVVGDDGLKQVLLADVALMENSEDLTCYRTSKNSVSFSNTKEKGKAISSSALTSEITNFLELDESIEHEFTLSSFDEVSEIESFVLKLMVDTIDVDAEEVLDTEENDPAIKENFTPQYQGLAEDVDNGNIPEVLVPVEQASEFGHIPSIDEVVESFSTADTEALTEANEYH